MLAASQTFCDDGNLQVSLDSGVLRLVSNQSLGVKDDVGEVNGDLKRVRMTDIQKGS